MRKQCVQAWARIFVLPQSRLNGIRGLSGRSHHNLRDCAELSSWQKLTLSEYWQSTKFSYYDPSYLVHR